MALSSFAIDSMVRGYNVYKDVWNATLDEELPCEREMDNTADRFAVAVNGPSASGKILELCLDDGFRYRRSAITNRVPCNENKLFNCGF